MWLLGIQLDQPVCMPGLGVFFELHFPWPGFVVFI